MSRNKVIDADAAARVILDGDTVAVGGFVGVAVPEELAAAVERRFLDSGSPRDLTLVFAAGPGDRGTRGLNHFARAGMVRRAIGGHWGLAPALGRLVIENAVEAYCLPQGVVSHLFRDIAAGRPGVISRVGLGTFVDPRVDGARLNARAVDDVVRLLEIDGEEYLFYPAFPVHVGLVRATTADEEGNLSLEREAITTDVLAVAQAVKNSGGIVIAQVERVTTRHHLPPQMVRVPGILVDAVVVADPVNHPQTFAEPYNPAYTGEVSAPEPAGRRDAGRLDARAVIARRAARYLRWNAIVNLGIGMPEGVAQVAADEGVLDLITLTVEPGAIGGVPASGLSFGASANPQSVIDQSSMFDFYDGGGLDQAFLGFAEVDAAGDVNVSRFGSRLAGAGGFINISQNAGALFFLGTFAERSQEEVVDGRLRIRHPGRPKFVERVSHVTFSAAQAVRRGQEVRYVTERCVLRLTPAGLEVIEVVPGVDLDRDVLAALPFRPVVAGDLRVMDEVILVPGRMGLAEGPVLSLRERVTYRPDADLLYLNFEGLRLDTEADAQELAEQLEAELASYGRRMAAVVNYDNFKLAPAAADRYWAMIRHNTSTYLSSTTRYSTNAFFRHQLGERFAGARLDGHLYRSFDEAVHHLDPPEPGR